MTDVATRSAGGITLLVLNPAAIQREYEPGGITWRYFRDIARETAEVAKAKLIPGRGYRTGELQRSVDFSVTPVPNGLQANVRASANHALYYHEGTANHGTGYIYPRHVYASGQQPRLRFVSRGRRWDLPRVRGQVGHPFLNDAKTEVLQAHGII